MTMKKAYKMTCPSCGAGLELIDNRNEMFCSYCGTKIYIDDGVDRSERKEYREAHISYSDLARIKEAEVEDRKHKRETKMVLLVIVILILFFFTCLGIIWLLPE